MPRLNHTDTILLASKKITVQEFIKSLIFLPAETVYNFFKKLGLTFPREARIFVLRENLREKVAETRKSRLTLADELNYRLSWFAEFTETQLENLLVFFDDQTINKNYLEDLWLEILTIMADQKVNAHEFEDLYNLSLQNEIQTLPDMRTFNRDIKYLFYDEEGKIDGLTPARVRPVLYKSSTLAEIRDFGDKYDVDVPRRLKKNELLQIIVKELKNRGDYTVEIENELKKMPVILMQRYATDHDIKASTELKKEEIIEYVLVNAKETKQEYFEPTEFDYDLEPDVVDEVVTEEKVEEVTEQPQVQQAVPVIDFSEIINEMRRLRHSVETLTSEMKKEQAAPKEVVIERTVVQEPVVIERTPEPVVEETPEPEVEEVIEEELIEEIIDDIVEEELAEEKVEEVIEEEVVPVVEEEVPEEEDKEEEIIEEVIVEEEVKPVEKVEPKKKKERKKRKPLFKRVGFWVFLILFLIALLILYFYLTYYNVYPIFMSRKAFEGFGNWLNKYIKISGTGLLDRAHQIIGRFHSALRKIPFIDKLIKK